MAARQLMDIFKDAVRRGDIAVAKVLLQCPAGESVVDAGMGAQGRKFGAEDECAILRGIEEGFLAEAVAAAEKAAPGAVVDDEGPHPVAAGGKAGVPLPVAVEQDLGVGVVGQEPVAARDELGAKLGKIIDLTVEYDDQV